jgi:dephospho-CoA kinase
MTALPTSLQLGLTGGIGSGKSTVAQLLVEQGAGLIDADALSRQSTAANGAAIGEIARVFGSQFIDENGALDRERMRTHCFALPAARKQLEAIIHPLVQNQSLALATQYIREGKWLVVWDIPLLVESGRWRPTLDRIVVVDCPEQTQIDRVIARAQRQGTSMTAETVRAIMKAQASRTQRLACADIVLFNDGLNLEQLGEQIQNLSQVLRLLQKPAQSGLSSAL